MPLPTRNTAGVYRYAYQGQEKDLETGMEAFELRLWDARIGRWLTTDPAGQYASPYLGMGNNPMNGTDPDGAEWIPSVDKSGNVTYIMEANDSPETLMSQYGLSEDEANEIWNRSGRGRNGSISGNIVKKVTGNEILKLKSLRNSQKNLEQFTFAMRHDSSKEEIFKITDYFSISKETPTSITIETFGSLDINGSHIKVWGEFRLLSKRNASVFGCRTGGCYSVPYAYGTFDPDTLESTTGTILGGGKNDYAIYRIATFLHFNGKRGNEPGYKEQPWRSALFTFKNSGSILRNYLQNK